MNRVYSFADLDPHALGMARAGEKVLYLANGGHDFQRAGADSLFARGQELTVAKVIIGGWESSYRFDGYDGAFNTVMFAPVAPLPEPPGSR